MKEATFIEEWLEEKLAEGLQQGLQQARLADVQRILRWRFGELPLALEKELGQLTAEQLEPLLDEALITPDLAAFREVVSRLITPPQSD